jgi:hypothetical protein
VKNVSKCNRDLRIQACANLNITVTHAATVYKFMLKMRGGNPAAFNHLQLEYATIPAADAKRDYLPMLIRSQESAVDQTGCVYELWISASARARSGQQEIPET